MDRVKCLKSVVRHDIFNVLTVITGIIGILMEDFNDEKTIIGYLNTISNVSQEMRVSLLKDENVQGQFQVLIGACQILHGLLKDNSMAPKLYQNAQRIKCILDMARSCTKSLSLKDFTLSEIVEHESRFMGIEVRMGNSNISFRTDCMFPRVVGNLFQNAIRHGKATTMSVSVKKNSDGSATIILEDDGCGIPAENKEKIFEYGFTTKMGEPGGEGLAYCKDILALSGASITETGTPEEGARFEIVIPKEDVIMIS